MSGRGESPQEDEVDTPDISVGTRLYTKDGEMIGTVRGFEEGGVFVTTRDDIDQLMRDALNWPRGLLEIADEYGVSRIVSKLETLHEETGWDEYEPNPLLEEMEQAETTGWPAGEGFYEWEYESTQFETVNFERREFLGIITIDRPEKMNALNRATWTGLREALEHADAHDSVRATLIRGRGKAFSAGDDIAEIHTWETVDDATEFFETFALPTFEALRHHSKPTIAVVDGIAAGGGCEMVLLSDLAVGSEQSEFGLSEALIGALPAWGLSYGLASLDKKDVMELAMTGDRISGREATDRGIINYAVSREQVEDVARELGRSTTAAAPSALATLKETWTEMEAERYTPLMEDYLERANENLFGSEGREGVTAFLDGEQPEWVR